VRKNTEGFLPLVSLKWARDTFPRYKSFLDSIEENILRYVALPVRSLIGRFRSMVPSFPLHGTDGANPRLCSFTIIGEAAWTHLRHLIVKERAGKSQDNGREGSVLKKLGKPGFHSTRDS
jgi:hypothetical protein